MLWEGKEQPAFVVAVCVSGHNYGGQARLRDVYAAITYIPGRSSGSARPPLRWEAPMGCCGQPLMVVSLPRVSRLRPKETRVTIIQGESR